MANRKSEVHQISNSGRNQVMKDALVDSNRVLTQILVWKHNGDFFADNQKERRHQSRGFCCCHCFLLQLTITAKYTKLSLVPSVLKLRPFLGNRQPQATGGCFLSRKCASMLTHKKLATSYYSWRHWRKDFSDVFCHEPMRSQDGVLFADYRNSSVGQSNCAICLTKNDAKTG